MSIRVNSSPCSFQQWQSEISNQGYIVLQGSGQDIYYDFIDYLGESIDETRIENSPAITTLLGSNQAMQMHNDHPCAHYIGWYCVSTADVGGNSTLLDSSALLEALDEDEVRQLGDIHVKFGKKPHFLPVISENGFYYTSWLVPEKYNTAHQALIKKVNDLLDELPKIEIALKEGDSLFIDNKRFLHGRTGFTESSKKRLLIRNWISTIQ